MRRLAILICFLLVVGWALPSAGASVGYRIVVDKSTNTLTLYQNGTVVRSYPVATGRSPRLTPEGTFPIVMKVVNPSWKNVPGGVPQNPLGKRWLGLSVHGDDGTTYGIHGTNRPDSIGTYASHGCIRMRNADVAELFRLIPVGTPVTIVNRSGKHALAHSNDVRLPVRSADGTLWTTPAAANIRQGASFHADILARLPRGTQLKVTGKAGSWYRVIWRGGCGFVHRSVVRSNPPVRYGHPITVTIAPRTAKIRTAPSFHAPVLRWLKQGTPLPVFGMSGDWYEIRIGDASGYVHRSVVRD
ncbi:L,D-transpeptidase family protein [Polycladomyces subterraneus]|uniref:L,D-transpeptidase family protein n=1 Tax=Polycladomyces subterraneus TaxID=1016997 RepID=A0ABT8IMW6_9BACL|nr:L,D-transpeptidase family protein [Polycladomyces subterraneus]MDN4593717.1 L,D-transpeptidase family protein [Polycladomyces subterraneus]